MRGATRLQLHHRARRKGPHRLPAREPRADSQLRHGVEARSFAPQRQQGRHLLPMRQGRAANAGDLYVHSTPSQRGRSDILVLQTSRREASIRRSSRRSSRSARSTDPAKAEVDTASSASVGRSRKTSGDTRQVCTRLSSRISLMRRHAACRSSSCPPKLTPFSTCGASSRSTAQEASSSWTSTHYERQAYRTSR